MMTVWVTQTRKRVECRYCKKFIEVDEFQVVCQYFMKLKHSDRTWTKKMHFHAKDPYCWIDRAVVEVGMKPHSETRGRKPDALDDESKLKRQRILRRRGSIMQRISNEIQGEMRPDKLAHMTDMLEGLVGEIEAYGGVPKSWM